MKNLAILLCIALAACAQPYQIKDDRAWTATDAEALTDVALCEKTATGLGTAAENREAEKRNLKCYKDHKNGVSSDKALTPPRNIIRQGSPLKYGMSRQEVITALGMSGPPAKIHKNATSGGAYEHWYLCRDWLNKWNLSRINCNPSMDEIYRMMFVNGKLESFGTY